MIRSLTLLLMLAAPAYSETMVSPSEFEAMSQGKTLYFERNGEVYGVEQFYKNHYSTWQYDSGQCVEGKWYADEGAFCFDYDDRVTPVCWYFTERDGQFYARVIDRPSGDPSELKLSHIDTNPVPCPAPDTGV